MSSAVLIAYFYVAVISVCSAVWLAVNKIRGVVVSEAQSVVDAVVAQLGKAKGEILAAIEELQVREPEVDLSALVAAAQALDDVVPDAPVEEEPVAE